MHQQAGRAPAFSSWGAGVTEGTSAPGPQVPPALQAVPALTPSPGQPGNAPSLNSACQLEANLHWIIIFN